MNIYLSFSFWVTLLCMVDCRSFHISTYDLVSFLLACVLSCFSHVQLLVTLWTVAHQAPLSMGFSRQEYWNGMPCPPPGYLPDPGIESTSLASSALTGGFFSTGAGWVIYHFIYMCHIFFMHLYVNGHLGCFHPGCCKSCYSDLCEWLCLFESWFSQVIYAVVGLLGHMIVVFSVFKGTSILFSTVAVTIFIPTHSPRGFTFPHFYRWWAFWYWPFWLVWGDDCTIDLICIYVIISDAEHLFMCFLAICTLSLEICLYRSFAFFFFLLDCLIFFEYWASKKKYWASWTVWIFLKLIPCQSFQLQIFSSILSLVFLSCLWFHLLCKMRWIQKDIAAVHGIVFWLCFPQGVL